jgi:hypothetical protein
MHRASSVIIAGLLAVAVLGGCRTVTTGPTEVGSGTPASEDRTVGEFDQVAVSSSIRADVRIGTPAGVRVTADDNLLDNIRTVVGGGKLEVGIDGSVSTTSPIVVEITVPSLTLAAASSTAQLSATGVASDSFRVVSESSGTVEVDGTVATLDVRGDSAGIARLGELAAATATVELESAAHAWIRVSGTVSGSVESASILSLVGQPGEVTVETDSAGQVVTE